MQKLVFLFLVLISTTINAQDSQLNWLLDFDRAKNISKEQDKPILVYFTGSDWCGPCKRLKADFFSSEDFKVKANDFVLLLVDMPRRTDIITPEQRQKNIVLMKKYNKKGSFPNIFGLDSNGKVLAEISGYNMMRDTSYHFAFLDKLQKKF
mmetsp:Transcript_14231/g.37687  ORF Transcript_14231/g.37687 Transcript_14231/m.37687 type:complete len:151 (+) Transcript_14231:685-1137(+)